MSSVEQNTASANCSPANAIIRLPVEIAPWTDFCWRCSLDVTAMILMRSLPDQLFLALHMCCEYRVRLDCVGALFEKGVHLMVHSSLGCFRSFQDVAAPASVNVPSICLSFPWPRRSAASRATSSSLLDRLDSYSYLQQQLTWCKHHACVSVAVCQQ